MKPASQLRFEDLAPDVQAKVLEQTRGVRPGPGSPYLSGELHAFDAKAAERSQKGRTRQRAGRGFEDELNAVHEIYRDRGLAKLQRVEAPAQWSEKLSGWTKKPGGGPCDYIGAAKVGRSVPCVIFDAKSWDRAKYGHEPQALHQLKTLLEFQKIGAIGFLLVRDRTLRICYLIHDTQSLTTLWRGLSVVLRSAPRQGKKKLDAGDYTHEYPFVREPSELLVSQSTPRWDWRALLEELERRKQLHADHPVGAIQEK